MPHEKEVAVQHTTGPTHTVRPHLQSNHTKLDTATTKGNEGRGEECKDMGGSWLEGGVHPLRKRWSRRGEGKREEEWKEMGGRWEGGVPASCEVFEDDHVHDAIELRQQ